MNNMQNDPADRAAPDGLHEGPGLAHTTPLHDHSRLNSIGLPGHVTLRSLHAGHSIAHRDYVWEDDAEVNFTLNIVVLLKKKMHCVQCCVQYTLRSRSASAGHNEPRMYWTYSWHYWPACS
jgi:hypothetical protein